MGSPHFNTKKYQEMVRIRRIRAAPRFMDGSPELIHFFKNAIFSISTYFIKNSRFIFVNKRWCFKIQSEKPKQRRMTM
jgi:hypothetical protein